MSISNLGLDLDIKIVGVDLVETNDKTSILFS